MIDSISIRNKFSEFSTLYANRGIDDFDTFISARVSDYYINQGCASTDTIYTEIEEAFSEPISDETGSDYCDNDGNEIADVDERNNERSGTQSS